MKPRRRMPIAADLLSEHQIQSTYFDMVRSAWPACRLIYAVPNAAKRSVALAAYMKREGMTAGVLDVNVDLARGQFHGMRIEFKKPGGKLTDTQRDHRAQLLDAGYIALVHTDAWAAFEDTRAYINGDHARFSARAE